MDSVEFARLLAQSVFLDALVEVEICEGLEDLVQSCVAQGVGVDFVVAFHVFYQAEDASY